MQPFALTVVVSKKERPLSLSTSLVNCMWVNRVEVGMELLHILLWQTNVIDVPIPPSWRVGGRGNYSFLYKLHHQVGYGCTHRRAHGAAKRLMIVLLFISKIAVPQNEL